MFGYWKPDNEGRNYTNAVSMCKKNQTQLTVTVPLSLKTPLYAQQKCNVIIFGLIVTQFKTASGWESTIKTVLVKLVRSHDATSIIKSC